MIRFRYKILAILLFPAIIPFELIASQTGVVPAAGDSNVLKVYFFLLVFATIINRLLQFVKVLFQWLWPKFAFLGSIGEGIWQFVKRQMDRLKLKYKEEDVRKEVHKVATAIALHGLGFIFGIIITLNFELGVIDLLGWGNIGPTLNYIATGILIGAGVDPIHSVFRFAEEKKKLKKLKSQINTSS